MARPVSKVGPLTTRGGVFSGRRLARRAWTSSNTAGSMIAGTAISIHSSLGFVFPVLQWRRLK